MVAAIRGACLCETVVFLRAAASLERRSSSRRLEHRRPAPGATAGGPAARRPAAGGRISVCVDRAVKSWKMGFQC